MDALTAVRSFGNPGYTPVRSRVYATRWYHCTFQNVERDPRCDYVGLAEGEYTKLLSGAAARRARDSRLNHLNAMVEYKGPVWSVAIDQRTTYYSTKAEADTTASVIRVERAGMLQKALAAIDQQVSMTDGEINAIYGKCSDWHGPESWRDFNRGLIAGNRAYWSAEPIIEQVKGA